MRKNKTPSLRTILLYILPAILFFSYFPVISLGDSSSMNLELSLPLLWLLAFDLISLIDFLKLAKKHSLTTALHGLSDKKLFLFSLFPLYITASALWSPNPLRAILTAGIGWLLFFAIFSIYQLLITAKCGKKYNTIVKTLKKSLYISTSIVCAWCWLQCILNLAGIPREAALLCRGCTYQSFGFPHPNGFAIEPQFMGNLLLAPTILILIEILSPSKNRPLRTRLPLLLLFSTTLFLTFSRGAIYSFAVATIIILAVTIIKAKSPQPLLASIPIVFSFLIALCSQGLMAELSPTTDTFTTGITKSLHHLSLGHLDLRPAPAENPVENSQPQTEEGNTNNSNFDGYVAESTDTRLKLTEYAINLWHQSPANLIFGIGLGGSGTALHEAYPDEFPTPKEIIQNEYLSLALETGLIGLTTITLSIIMTINKLRQIKSPQKSSNKLLFLALAVAYAISLCFFAGLPNALHIYFFLALSLIGVII